MKEGGKEGGRIEEMVGKREGGGERCDEVVVVLLIADLRGYKRRMI